MTANRHRRTAARRASTRTRRAGARRRGKKQEQGFALLIAVIAVAILSVLVTDLHETTGTSFAAAMAERDHLRAEYMAKSGVNLTRMLVGQERNLRALVEPLYQAMLSRRAPQIPVWRFADMILKPFSDFEASKEDVASAGYDLDMSEGLGETRASFEVHAAAENGKINLNDPRIADLAQGHANVAMQLYSLMGGTQPSPNKYDPLFSEFDEKGRLTTRLDVVANVLDWWDADEQRTSYDPVLLTASTSGGEDTDYYRTLPQPYAIKNAPFDSIEELRLVRGIDDDFWATFVEPSLDDPGERLVTIYGAAKVNPNEAAPLALLARLCTYPEVAEQLLCGDPTGMEALKFVQLLSTARMLTYGAPFFSRSGDFVNFVTGKPDGLYGKLSSVLTSMGMGETMLFTPLVVEDAQLLRKMRGTFTTTARFIAIDVVGRSGNSTTRVRTVINTDPKWTPPEGTSGKLPPLGVFAYYRIE
jgi:general secretion pathway protein K